MFLQDIKTLDELKKFIDGTKFYQIASEYPYCVYVVAVSASTKSLCVGMHDGEWTWYEGTRLEHNLISNDFAQTTQKSRDMCIEFHKHEIERLEKEVRNEKIQD